MALTKEKRQALEMVREAIKRTSDPYPHICHLLMSVASMHPHLSQAADELVRYIRTQLGGAPVLETWQNKKGFIVSTRDHRRDRLAWVEWMLEE